MNPQTNSGNSYFNQIADDQIFDKQCCNVFRCKLTSVFNGCTLFKERRSVPVFEEKQLQDILERLGLLEKMLAGGLVCFFCKERISKQNFGALFVSKNSSEVSISCSRPDCLKLVGETIES